MQALFWISFAVLFYTYLGYGILLFVLTLFSRRRRALASPEYLPLTVVVPAYNEADILEKKIQNTLALHYPPGKLFFLFATDGSTDGTSSIIDRYTQLTVLHGSKRLGKTAAINRAMQKVATPLVVFTDANTLLHPDCLLQMVPHFADERVGGVAGEKRIFDAERSAVGLGERLYWQYESLLKKADSNFYSVIGAAGELFAIRSVLFQPLEENVILDDLVISGRISQQGFRMVYENKAFATETSSASMREERTRKTRISAGCFQAMTLLRGLFNPFRHSRLFFQYVSHRVLRWTLCPLCLPLLFLSNGVLAISGRQIFYSVFFGSQILFYCFALTGCLLSGSTRFPRLLLVPYYFVFMNLSLYAGFYRFVTGRQSVMWKKAVRKPLF